MIRANVTLLILLVGLSATAQTKKCEEFAQGVAEMKYLAVSESGIQGHEWSNKVTSYSVDDYDGSVTVGIQIDGRNDDYDTWVSRYEVVVDTSKGCQSVRVKSIK